MLSDHNGITFEATSYISKQWQYVDIYINFDNIRQTVVCISSQGECPRQVYDIARIPWDIHCASYVSQGENLAYQTDTDHHTRLFYTLHQMLSRWPKFCLPYFQIYQ